MKSILLFVFIVINVSVFAQDSAITYTSVVQVEGITKNKIYERVISWMADNFVTSKSAIQVADKEAGMIATNAYIKTYFKSPPRKKGKDSLPDFANYWLKLKIQIKDGRYKYEITDLKWVWDDGSEYRLTSSSKAPFQVWLQPQTATDKTWDIVKQNAERQLMSVMAKLEASIKSQKDDW